LYDLLSDEGDMYTWGKGKYGSLGLYKTDVQYFPLKVTNSNTKQIR